VTAFKAEYISRKEARPSKAFSLLYFATQEFEVSLRLATASATFGSFLSMFTVVLTLLITSSVSLTYSSSDPAKAGVIGRTNGEVRIAVAKDRKWRRAWWFRGCCCCGVGGGESGAMELGLGLMGERGLSLEAGVRSAGEAMGFLLEEEQSESVFYRGVVRRPQGSCHVGLSPYPYSWFCGRDHTQS